MKGTLFCILMTGSLTLTGCSNGKVSMVPTKSSSRSSHSNHADAGGAYKDSVKSAMMACLTHINYRNADNSGDGYADSQDAGGVEAPYIRNGAEKD